MPKLSDLPSSSSSSSTSLISTPFSCPQAPPFEYPYPTPNALSTSPPSYTPSNVATISFSLGLHPDGQADNLRGKFFPIWMSLSKMKGINDIKPPIPPGLMRKAAVLPPTSPSQPKDAHPVSSMNPDHQHWRIYTLNISMRALLSSFKQPLTAFRDNIDRSLF